jgi:O-antigen/teichoic acid export membrane protein
MIVAIHNAQHLFYLCPMSLKKLGGETIIYGLSSVLGRMLSFVIATYFVLQVMDRSQFGVVSDLMFFTALLIAVLVFRMDTVVFRFASREAYDSQAVFRKAQRWVLISVAVVIGVLLIFSGQLADMLKYPDRVIYVQLVLATVALDALSMVPLARLRLEQRPWFFVLVNLGNVLFNILMIFLLLFYWRWNSDWFAEQFGWPFQKNYQVGYYLFGIAMASGFRYALLLIDGTVKSGRKWLSTQKTDLPNVRGLAPSARTMLSYALPLTVVGVAGITNFLVAPSIIKYYHGGTVTENLAFAGDFGAAMKLAVFLNLFVTAYNYAAEPFFFRQAGKDVATADKTIYADAMRAYAIVATLASAGIMLFLPWLQYFLEESKRGGLYVLPLLLAANFCFGLFSNLSVAYKLTDKTIYGGAIALIGSGIVIGGSMAFTPVYGLWAPAWAMLACFVVMSFLGWLVSRRFFPVYYPWGQVFIYVLLAIGAVCLGGVAGADWWIRGAVFAALLAASAALDWKWLKKTFG